MKTTRLALVAVVAAAVAHPALAGVVYVPAANMTRDGVLRKSQVVYSNQDVANLRGASVRFIPQNVAGVPLPPGPFTQLWTAAGATQVIDIPTSVLPADSSGMLEVFPGRTDMIVGARMVYEKTSVYSTAIDFPAISSHSVRPAGTSIFLQGLEHGAVSGVLTDLGVYNFGTAAATCTMDLHDGLTGAVLATAVPFAVPAVSSLLFADFFAETANLQGLEVSPNSWAKVTCNQTFWAFGVRHNANTGATAALLPTSALDQSTLSQPGATPSPTPTPPPPPPGGTVLLSRPGTFLIFSNSTTSNQHNVRYGMQGGNFRRITIDYDFFNNRWDPSPQKAHCILWFGNGSSWSNMMAYMNAIDTQGIVRFQVNFGVGRSEDRGPQVTPGGWYHVSYEYSTVAGNRKVFYKIYKSTETGNIGPLHNAGVSFNHSRTSVGLSGGFVELGTQKAPEGPEAKTLGWKFANLRIVGYQ